MSQVNAESEQATDTSWDPPIDLSRLNEPERVVVQNMLLEECSSFSKSEDDIGCNEKLKLSILLKDMDPEARTYLSVPKPLYKKIKDYLHNLIAQGWVKKIQHTLCLTGCWCKEKGWQPTSLHRLQRTKQEHPLDR